MNEITGRLYKKSKIEEKLSKKGDTYYIRDFIIETDGRFKDYIPFELFGENCSMLDNFEIGDVLNISYYLKGNLWKDKAIVHLAPNKIVLAMPSNGTTDITYSDNTFDDTNTTQEYTQNDEIDDLPF